MPSRRARAAVEVGSEAEVVPPRRRGRSTDTVDEGEHDDDQSADEETDGGAESQDQSVKKLVRYALACEFQRLPIKRTGIAEKVLGKQRGSFKRVFEGAQQQLRTKFGMEMVELPSREKVTLKEKRAAQKSKGVSKATASYILTTILPVEYRIPEIITPSIIGSAADEAAYIGLCTVIVALIALNPGGSIPDHKLERYLRRLNTDKNTPVDSTAATLAKMQRQGYILKTVDRTGDEETIDWRVGPRGKAEIGNRGIKGLVNEVYGNDAPVDLEKRLQRSLGIEVGKGRPEDEREDGEEEDQGDQGAGRVSGRRRRVASDGE